MDVCAGQVIPFPSVMPLDCVPEVLLVPVWVPQSLREPVGFAFFFSSFFSRRKLIPPFWVFFPPGTDNWPARLLVGSRLDTAVFVLNGHKDQPAGFLPSSP